MIETASASTPSFLFVTCQVGAEPAVKAEVARQWPDFRFAYSRPGFLTFKLPAGQLLADDFDLRSVFARAHGFSLGKVVGETDEELARNVWKLVGDRPFDRLHVWQRDIRPAGDHGYVPGPTPAVDPARAELVATAPADRRSLTSADPLAQPSDLVLDCVLVEPREWWIGFHRARTGPSQRAGGYCDITIPSAVVSRAYTKMAEALAWSQLPVAAGQQFVELGCAPGGSCQRLLELGLEVVGIDPAAMDPAVLSNPRFTHIRKRAADVRRREFRKSRWLSADMNVAPEYTLDAVEAIVAHDEVHIQGLLLTLKLVEWSLANELPSYLERIRSWGFPQVTARQLQHGRQEVCVAAVAPAPRKRRGGVATRSSRRASRG